MIEALKALASSKKFIVAVVAALVWIAGRFGLALDKEEVLGIVSPLLAYIVGQGIADTGKHAPAKEPEGN